MKSRSQGLRDSTKNGRIRTVKRVNLRKVLTHSYSLHRVLFLKEGEPAKGIDSCERIHRLICSLWILFCVSLTKISDTENDIPVHILRSYMQPLEPELMENKPADTEIGRRYDGRVIDHRENRIQIELDEERVASIPIRDVKGLKKGKDIREALPEGTRVTVTYLGKEKNKDIWSCEI